MSLLKVKFGSLSNPVFLSQLVLHFEGKNMLVICTLRPPRLLLDINFLERHLRADSGPALSSSAPAASAMKPSAHSAPPRTPVYTWAPGSFLCALLLCLPHLASQHPRFPTPHHFSPSSAPSVPRAILRKGSQAHPHEVIVLELEEALCSSKPHPHSVQEETSSEGK